MKMEYETPWLQIERFDLDDPEIVASYDSGNNDGTAGGPGGRGKMLFDGLEF